MAKEIGVPAQRIGDIVARKRAITTETDLRLCRFFGLSDGYWLRGQARFDTETAKDSMVAERAKIKRWKSSDVQNDVHRVAHRRRSIGNFEKDSRPLFDLKTGLLRQFKRFQDDQRAQAQRERLDIELSLDGLRELREVVLLEADQEETVRRTHRRYFETTREIVESMLDAEPVRKMQQMGQEKKLLTLKKRIL